MAQEGSDLGRPHSRDREDFGETDRSVSDLAVWPASKSATYYWTDPDGDVEVTVAAQKYIVVPDQPHKDA